MTGCKAQLRQEVSVRSADRVEVALELRVSGPAAKAIMRRPEILNRLDAYVRDRSPEFTRTGDAKLLVWHAPLAPERIAELSGVTGLGEARIVDRDPVTVRVRRVTPTQLRSALREVPDKAAVPVLLHNTEVTTAVEFPGGVGAVRGSLAETARRPDATHVTVTTRLDAIEAGTLVVAGDPSAPRNWAPYGVSAVLLAGMGVLAVTLRRKPSAPR